MRELCGQSLPARDDGPGDGADDGRFECQMPFRTKRPGTERFPIPHFHCFSLVERAVSRGKFYSPVRIGWISLSLCSNSTASKSRSDASVFRRKGFQMWGALTMGGAWKTVSRASNAFCWFTSRFIFFYESFATSVRGAPIVA